MLSQILKIGGINSMSITNIIINPPKPRVKSTRQSKERVKCGRCVKGYTDYPVCMQICSTCEGTTWVRV